MSGRYSRAEMLAVWTVMEAVEERRGGKDWEVDGKLGMRQRENSRIAPPCLA